jgi:quercetin dioxygenase-like cupin family protein
MKIRTSVSTLVLAVVMILSSGVRLASAQDVVKVAPASHKILLENEKVRVYEFTSKPGEKVGMHSHPAHVVYFLDAGKVRFTFPDGKTSDLDVQKGGVRYADPVTHALENVGTTEVHAIIVELKGEKAAKPEKAKTK